MNRMLKHKLEELGADPSNSRYQPMRLMSDDDLTEAQREYLCGRLEEVAASEFGQDFAFEAKVMPSGEVIVDQVLTVVDEPIDINKEVSRQAFSKYVGKDVETGIKVRNRVHPKLCEGLEEVIMPATTTVHKLVSVEEK